MGCKIVKSWRRNDHTTVSNILTFFFLWLIDHADKVWETLTKLGLTDKEYCTQILENTHPFQMYVELSQKITTY